LALPCTQYKHYPAEQHVFSGSRTWGRRRGGRPPRYIWAANSLSNSSRRATTAWAASCIGV